MKNKIIRNLIRNMKNNGDGKRTYESVRSRKARMMALTLCAALALGQAGAVAYAQASGDKAAVQTSAGRRHTAETGNMADMQSTANKGNAVGMGIAGNAGTPVNMLFAANTASSAGRSKTTGTASGADKSAAAEDVRTAKEETVYILAGADGSVQKIIVSDWLKNAAGDSTISDISELTDIENVRDDLHYTDEGNVKVWDARETVCTFCHDDRRDSR